MVDVVPRGHVDVVPGAKLGRVVGEPHSFEISSDTLPNRRNMFGNLVKKVMIFAAENESVLMEWLYHILAITGVPSPLVKVYVDFERRSYLANLRNDNQQTLLDTLVTNASQAYFTDAVSLADWLIVQGALIPTSLAVTKSSALQWKEYFNQRQSISNISAPLSFKHYVSVGYSYLVIYIQQQAFKASANRYANFLDDFE